MKNMRSTPHSALGVVAFCGAFFSLFALLPSAHAEWASTHPYRWSLVRPPSLVSPTVSMKPAFAPTHQTLIAQSSSIIEAPTAPNAERRTKQTAKSSSRSACSPGKRCAMDEKSEELVKVLHQIFGIGSLVLLTATVILGQINAIDFMEGRLSSQAMLWAHRGLAIATAVAYGGARVLAWIMPSEKEEGGSGKGFDSAKAHNVLSWLHGIGMIALIVGGVMNRLIIPSSTDAKIAMTVSHLGIGYFTWVTLSAAAVVITFF